LRTVRPHDDRARAALGSLSAVGAGVAGFGAGVLFADRVPALAWPALVGGVVVHLFGMVGAMRLQSAEGYRPARLERFGYWACWLIIGALFAYAIAEWLR